MQKIALAIILTTASLHAAWSPSPGTQIPGSQTATGWTGNSPWPQIALANNGAAVAVWVQGTSNEMLMVGANYTGGASGTWSFTNLTSAGSGVASTPALAVNPTTGDAAVVWVQTASGMNSVMAANYSATTPTWTVALSPLQGPTGDTLTSLSIGMDSLSNALATWADVTTTTTWNLESASYVRSWTTLSPILTSPTVSTFGLPPVASTAVTPSGTAVVVYSPDNMTAWAIYGNSNTGTWNNASAAQLTTTITNSYYLAPTLSMNSDGDAMVCWWNVTQSMSVFAIQFGALPVSFGSGTPVVNSALQTSLASFNISVGGSDGSPLFGPPGSGINAAGNAAIVWQSLAETAATPDVTGTITTSATTYTPGASFTMGSFGSPDIIDPAYDFSYPAVSNVQLILPNVAVDSSGNAYAIWQRVYSTDNSDGVYTAANDPGTWSTTPTTLSTTGTEVGFPRIAVDSADPSNQYAIWALGPDSYSSPISSGTPPAGTGSTLQIQYAQNFTPPPPPSPPPSPPSPPSPHHRYHPAPVRSLQGRHYLRHSLFLHAQLTHRLHFKPSHDGSVRWYKLYVNGHHTSTVSSHQHTFVLRHRHAHKRYHYAIRAVNHRGLESAARHVVLGPLASR